MPTPIHKATSSKCQFQVGDRVVYTYPVTIKADKHGIVGMGEIGIVFKLPAPSSNGVIGNALIKFEAEIASVGYDNAVAQPCAVECLTLLLG